jgi:hypothetical protein
MKKTFAAKTFAAKTFRCVTLGGTAGHGPYYCAAVETAVSGAAAGCDFHAGAVAGQHSG